MTMFANIAATALLLAPAPGPMGSAFDRPLSELNDSDARGPLDRMSLNQLMRFSTLPPTRLREFQCAGVVTWQGSKAWPVFALNDDQRTQFIDRVARALANDVEMDRDIADALIVQYSKEPPHREKKGELESWRKEVEGDCRDLLVQVRSGDYELSPLASPSVVDTTLATCYARYAAAAERSEGKEAEGLKATADNAERLALAGKSGAALDKAKAALAERLAAERAEERNANEQDMMQLVICLPALKAADMDQAK